MPILPPSAHKHSFDGIGSASAAGILAALAANPSTTFLATGFAGKIVFWLLAKTFEKLASMGLVLLNIGAEKLIIAAEKVEFDGSFESAEKMMEAIRNTGRELTPEEIEAIDGPVIEQLRKFGRIVRKTEAWEPTDGSPS